jgi:hypothetical protein
MKIFSPIKKRANQFRYVPRYYDPEKERRDQRRKEMYGTSSEDDGEYTPGQYIRTQREARRLSKVNSGANKKRPTTLVLLLAGLAIAAIVLYPHLVSLFEAKQANQVARVHMQDEKAIRREQMSDKASEEEYVYDQAKEDAVWPYRHVNSITIVSNDSKEE